MGSSQFVKKVVNSVMWNYGIFALGKFLVFMTTVVLARYLSPEDFGLMAMAFMVINYLKRLRSFGVDDALIYHQDQSRRALDTAFFLNIIFGSLLTVLTFCSAPVISEFFNAPGLISIVQVLSAWFIITNLGSAHDAVLRRDLRFKAAFIPQICQRFVKGVLSIGLAVAGWGVWSLVWGQMAGVACATVIYWIMGGWLPRLRFDPQILMRILSYGSQTVFLKFLQGIFKNIDYLIIGHRLGATELGLYTIAFRLPDILIGGIQSAVMPVLFPAFSKMQADTVDLGRAFLTAFRFITLVTLPMGVGLMVIARDFVTVFYTQRWVAAVPVMQALSIYIIATSFDSLAQIIYKSTGRLSTANITGIIKTTMAVAVLWPAAEYGIVAVAASQVGIALAANFMQLIIISRLIHIRAADIRACLKPSLTAVCVMLPGLFGTGRLLDAFAPWVRLAVLTGLGLILYTGALYLFYRPLVMQTMALFVTGRQSQ